MKIVLALASSSGQLSGVQRHAINLAHCLISRPEIAEVHLAAAPWQEGFVRESAPCGDRRFHLHTASIGNSALSRNWWFYSHLPRLAAQLDADIVPVAASRLRSLTGIPLGNRLLFCPRLNRCVA
jgi:hypothetical protein